MRRWTKWYGESSQEGAALRRGAACRPRDVARSAGRSCSSCSSDRKQPAVARATAALELAAYVEPDSDMQQALVERR